MGESKKQELSRRERQVMDILYAQGKASVARVQAGLADHPSYSATRMLLQRLHKKGLARYETDGAKYIYLPAVPKSNARRSAWERLVDTFFAGSAANAFSSLLDESVERLSDTELDELERLVNDARARRAEED